MSEIHRVAIVMSRMPRLIAPDAVWLRGLSACLRRIHERRQVLLAIPGTAGAEFVLRGANRVQVTTEILPIDHVVSADSSKDQHLIGQADEVFALGVRKDGNIQRLLHARLQAGRGGVILVDLPGLQPEPVRRELVAAGAAIWIPPESDLGPLATPTRTDEDVSLTSTEIVCLFSHEAVARDSFLTHTTRACPGPWPRQPIEDYLDRLLDAQPDGDHSALMTLSRIVRERLLIGSGKSIRGGFPVVSLTAVPLPELPELRCFRTHRSRWDFEPYGVCIRRSALKPHQVRPVVYGSEETWKSMPDAERPFFQLSGDVALDSNADQPLDWSSEQEWRIVGDLDLSQFTSDDLFVFVPTFADAKILQPHCPWPVTLWPGDVSSRK